MNSTPNDISEIITQSGGTNRNLTYDFNGSLVNDGLTRTFEWDGANRLVAINTGTTNRSEFTYDGLSRCAKSSRRQTARSLQPGNSSGAAMTCANSGTQMMP